VTTNARERLCNWLNNNGRRHVELAEVLCVDKARLSRFLAGKAALATVDHYRKVEAFTAGAIRADELAAEAPPTGARRPRVARQEAAGHPSPSRLPQLAPAPTPAVPSPVSPVAQAGDLPVGFAANARIALSKLLGIPIEPGLSEDELLDRLRGPLFPVLLLASLKLVLQARGEGARQRAIDSLCDRLYGRATQRIVDATPRPPVVDAEVIAVFERLVGVTPAALPSAALPPKEGACPKA
jgi:hypothetical protein